MTQQSLSKRIQKLYYDLYSAQMRGDWSNAEKIQQELERLEREEKRFDVS